MWQAIVFGFLGGVLGANGFPHFTRGITKRRYPSQLGNGPVPNFLAGWAALVIAAVLLYFAHVGRHPGWSLGPAAIGVLLMGLFHAGPGAFGRPEPDSQAIAPGVCTGTPGASPRSRLRQPRGGAKG